jgi:hypothetical protein
MVNSFQRGDPTKLQSIAKAVDLTVGTMQFSAAGLLACFFVAKSRLYSPMMRDSCWCSCMHEQIKIITLDEETYGLLKMWKASNRGSFSKVIKRVVSISGTVGALLACLDEAGTAQLPANEAMEEAINFRPTSKNATWS